MLLPTAQRVIFGNLKKKKRNNFFFLIDKATFQLCHNIF